LHCVSTGHRQRNQQQKCCEAYGNERPLPYITPNLGQIKKMIEPNKGSEVKAGIEKSE